MTADEIDVLLADQVVARIGCHAEGETYVVPVTLVAHEGAFFGFSHEGRKLAMMRVNPSVCVEIDRVCHLGSWRSIVAWGTFEQLEGDQACRGAGIIAARLRSLAMDDVSRRRLEDALVQEPAPVVYRIVVGSMTGRIEGEG